MLQMIFETVLRMSMQGAIIFAVVFLMRFILKKLHISHKYIAVLWVILFFYLVFPWKIELPIGFWNADAIQWVDSNEAVLDSDVNDEYNAADTMKEEMPAIKEQENVTIPEEYFALQPINPSAPIEYIEIPFSGDEVVDATDEGGVHTLSESQVKGSFLTGVKSVIPYIWCVIAMVLFGHFIWSCVTIQKKLSVSKKGSDNIYYVQDIETTMVFGVIKPRIYLPLTLEENNLFYVLSHERMHIKRGDHIFKILAYVVCIIHWFNPLVWVAYHMLGEDIEKACDEAVILGIGEDKKKDYANALLLAAETGNRKGKRVFVAPICFDEGNVKSRIKNIIKYKYTLPIAGTVVLVVAVVLGIVFITKGSDETDIQSDKENILAESTVEGDEPQNGDMSMDSTVEESIAEENDSQVITDPYYIDSETMRRVGFHDLLGYDGYFITKKDSTPMETTYYAVEGDETFIIAKSWGFERDDYFRDVDGDGVRELLCNVCWGDGAQDTLIYCRFEDGIRVAYGSSLLDEEYDNYGAYSLYSSFDITSQKVVVEYWKEENQSYNMNTYELNLEAIPTWYRPDIPETGDYILKSLDFYVGDIPVTVAAFGKEIGDYEIYGIKELDVYINDSLSQTLIMQEAIEKDGIPMVEEGYTRCPESIAEEHLIKTVDINFDGYLDLQVYAWDTKDDDLYYYYCWNPEENEFEYAFCLNTDKIDDENQLLITHDLISRYEMYHYNYYKVNEDNTLELVKTVEDPVEDDGY
ncbi:MAG: M56 family metallopeptidase [Lachnospiraceae bacterium]|nr:M56 family metallopeptidase [Lachnospiraceae bacterium]